jgi:arylsulfatase
MADYNTAMAGKWHLSRTPELPDPQQQLKWLNHHYSPDSPFAPLETYPVNRGFDKFYGVIWGVINHFDPFSLVEGTERVKEVPGDYYFGDAITDKAIEYVKEFSQSDKPFFLYYAHCAPHWPLHALPSDIAKYKDTYIGGWGKLRKDRFQRQLQKGLFRKENTPLPPVQGNGPGWEALTDKQKEYQARKMAVHAAMVDRIDQNIGRLLDVLEQTGQLDNTLILFFSDNGASPEVVRQPSYDRNSETRKGQKVHYEPAPLELLGSELSYTCIGSYWASAVNTPFRYWKKESFEGGCNTPLIIHWPAGLQTKPAAIISQPGHVMDILPTCLDAAGVSYPDSYKNHTLLPLEGRSLMPILKGKKREPYKAMFFEHEKGKAVRIGDWKLVAYSNDGKWELYNLAEDLTETNNLAEKYPDRVIQMKTEWLQWTKKVGLDTSGNAGTEAQISTKKKKQ